MANEFISESFNRTIVPLYRSEEELRRALDSTEHLRCWNFRGARCDRCGIPNSKVDGLLIQCGLCKKAHYCSRKCFNEDLEHHQSSCQSSILRHQPRAGPNIYRRGDEGYQETDEQKRFIQMRDKEMARKREIKPTRPIYSPPLEPSPQRKEEKARRSWDWESLFAEHYSIGNLSARNTHVESDSGDDADDDGTDTTHNSAPDQVADDDVESQLPAQVESNEPEIAGAAQIHMGPQNLELQLPVASKDLDEEEKRRNHHIASSVSEVDSEHRRRLQVGNGDIPDYQWKPELIDLNEAKLIKRSYSWEVPEWVKNRRLRSVQRDENVRSFRQVPAWVVQSPLKRCLAAKIDGHGKDSSKGMTSLVVRFCESTVDHSGTSFTNG